MSMSPKKKIEQLIVKNRATLLGVGPMSRECVDAAIRLANDYGRPILLIASRRQVDSEEFGGGYVENWNTKDFAAYVRKRDKGHNIILARDHGGPWQNDLEVQRELTPEMAMESAKRSFAEDIRSGFEYIHIDTSVNTRDCAVGINENIERLLDLYTFCIHEANDIGAELVMEIGTEEQSGSTDLVERNEYMLSVVHEKLKCKGIPLPHFIVMQTGTKVISDRNEGSLDSLKRKPGEVPSEIIIPQILNMCKRKGIFLKEHNLDYVSDELLKWHPRLGVHAANVAPEFGVAQSKVILDGLQQCGEMGLFSRVIELAVQSNKWQKWYDPVYDQSDYRKAVLSLHYSFSSEAFKELRADVQQTFRSCNRDLHAEIEESLVKNINRYLRFFNYSNEA